MGAAHRGAFRAFASLFHHYSHDSRHPNLPKCVVKVHRLIYCEFWPGGELMSEVVLKPFECEKTGRTAAETHRNNRLCKHFKLQVLP